MSFLGRWRSDNAARTARGRHPATGGAARQLSPAPPCSATRGTLGYPERRRCERRTNDVDISGWFYVGPERRERGGRRVGEAAYLDYYAFSARAARRA
jgi:hypothetical protein